ncbi:MAG: glycosyl hydrolase 53 family protein, partial [Prevotellaceae bacterium]|nr:glycosyl hydrolase 53 family protein [Prevotellaceae bacterium]
WTNIEKQADELSQYFSLIWVPQSGNCNSSYNQMGYTPVYYFNHDSSFGSESQLRSMISTFKNKGTGIIADVVINHRNNLGQNGSWTDYPSEQYKGTDYSMTSTDICRNDDGGKTLTWANSNGVALSSNSDTGDDWDGCRDLDHKSTNVNRVIKTYLSYLINDLGYAGFRYDMVKGYSASFTKDYNLAARPAFSVGEYWDSSTKIKQWINASDDATVPSRAFDFQFRYRVRDAINGNNWNLLSASKESDAGIPLIYNATYRDNAVTFVENHDTEYRSSSSPQDPLKKDTLAANAFMLAMPGVPCVFLKHWTAYKQEIKSMIEARRLAGIKAESNYEFVSSNIPYMAVKTEKLIAVVGANTTIYHPSAAEWTEVLQGKGYRYYLANSLNTAWLDKASGEYEDGITVTAKAVTDNVSAQLVYSINGGEWTLIATGGTIPVTQNCTVKCGLMLNGVVSGIGSRTYTINHFEPHTVTVYVRNENQWQKMNFYAWDMNNKELNGSWPGRAITDTVVKGGFTWYRQNFNITSKDYYFNLVFSTGTGTPQTVDVNHVTEDSYFVITTSRNGDKYQVAETDCVILGDANDDGTVDVSDITCIANYILTSKPTTAFSFRNADINLDGVINVSDITATAAKILGADKKAFKVGADIGWYTQMESQGYTFQNASGQTVSCPRLMKEYGCDIIRLRVWVNPSDGWCGKDDLITKAKAAVAEGMDVMVDFHFGDSWCDPGQQPIPAAWKGHTAAQMATDIDTHVRDILSSLTTVGIVPKYVQIGNETDNGFLWDTGSASKNPSQYAALLKAGCNAAKAVCPDIKTIIHISNAWKMSVYQWQFESIFQPYGVDFDILGMSLYPSYTTEMTASECIAQYIENVKTIYKKYGKDCMLVEVGLPVDGTDSPAMMKDILQRSQYSTDGHCLGVLYWEPESWSSWYNYKLGAATANGKTIRMNAIFEAFKNR